MQAEPVVLPADWKDAAEKIEPKPFNHRTDCPLNMFALTDMGNAERFQFRYGDKFIHTAATGWLIYRKGVWSIDKTGRAARAMQNVVRLIRLEAELAEARDNAETLKSAIIGWGCKSESNAKRMAALDTAKSLLARDYADFDQKPDLFNCANGTLELSTGKFREHDPNDLLTKQSPVVHDPEAKCPKWEKFLSEVTEGNQNLVAYLHRAGGYTMSASIGEHDMFMPWGLGGGGKGTFLTVMQGVMGGYARTADAEMFMSRMGDSGQPFDIAGMEGVRALIAAETQDNKRIATAKIKRMTGGDRIRACHKGKDSYEFQPIWKIWLATNDFPKVHDEAAWQRLKPIKFDRRFRDTAEEIKNLGTILLAEESSGILNWFLSGHSEWLAHGMMEPEEVVGAAVELNESEDFIGHFIEERLVHTDIQDEFISKADAFERFKAWADAMKEGRGITATAFGKMMRDKGFKDEPAVRVKGKVTKVWHNLKASRLDYTTDNLRLDPEDLR